jgi:hypothetical protein
VHIFAIAFIYNGVARQSKALSHQKHNDHSNLHGTKFVKKGVVGRYFNSIFDSGGCRSRRHTAVGIRVVLCTFASCVLLY